MNKIFPRNKTMYDGGIDISYIQDAMLSHYATLAERTNADLGDYNKNVLHMALGIKTEIAEIYDIFKRELAYGKLVDIINLEEEIGDLMWYLTNLNTISKGALVNRSNKLAYIIDNSLGFFVTFLYEDYQQALYLIARLIEKYDLDMGQILNKNIAKLKARFPEKFTQEKALNRNLNKERDILENV